MKNGLTKIQDTPPRAVRESTLFDGRVDVYELEDGRLVLSNRGAESGLTGTTGKGMLSRYTAGFLQESRAAGCAKIDPGSAPKQLENSAASTAAGAGAELGVFEFITPRGARSKGIELTTFKKLVSWWSHQFIAGKLREDQRHIGANCAAMQSAAADLGWEAFARSAFGQALPPKDVPIMFAEYLREHAAQYEKLYEWELAYALAPLIRRRGPLPREQWPKFMLGIHQFLNDTMLSKQIADEARRRRKEAGTATVHEFMNEPTRKTVASYMPILIGIARECQSLEQWKAMVRSVLNVSSPDRATQGTLRGVSMRREP